MLRQQSADCLLVNLIPEIVIKHLKNLIQNWIRLMFSTCNDYHCVWF